MATASAGPVHHSSAVLQQVSDAARGGLNAYLEKIPAGREKNYGFESRDQFARATLGRPYHMVSMDAAGGSIDVIDTWRVPILVNGRFKALLTVGKKDGAWKTVEIGAAKLSRELEGLESSVVKGRSDVQVAIVRVFALRSDFLGVASAKADLEAGRFYPMQSAQKFLTLKGSDTYNYAQLKTLLAGKLEQNR
jgi:hypothetical protein